MKKRLWLIIAALVLCVSLLFCISALADKSGGVSKAGSVNVSVKAAEDRSQGNWSWKYEQKRPELLSAVYDDSDEGDGGPGKNYDTDEFLVVGDTLHTGKPVKATIGYGSSFRDDWLELYRQGTGIIEPLHDKDIYYIYPDGKEYKDAPTELGKYQARVKLNIKPYPPSETGYLYKDFSIYKYEKLEIDKEKTPEALAVGENGYSIAVNLPEEAKGKVTLQYGSDDPDIVEVSEDGKLTPKNPGSTEIWVKTDSALFKDAEARQEIQINRWDGYYDIVSDVLIAYKEDKAAQANIFEAKQHLFVEDAKYTGKPVAAHIILSGKDDWREAYRQHIGIAKPLEDGDIYYVYPDGSISDKAPSEPGFYQARIDNNIHLGPGFSEYLYRDFKIYKEDELKLEIDKEKTPGILGVGEEDSRIEVKMPKEAEGKVELIYGSDNNDIIEVTYDGRLIPQKNKIIPGGRASTKIWVKSKSAWYKEAKAEQEIQVYTPWGRYAYTVLGDHVQCDMQYIDFSAAEGLALDQPYKDEVPYTGKPVAAHIKFAGKDDWREAYRKHMGIVRPLKDADIYYIYPDLTSHKEAPTEPGRYQARIDLNMKTKSEDEYLRKDFTIYKPLKLEIDKAKTPVVVYADEKDRRIAVKMLKEAEGKVKLQYGSDDTDIIEVTSDGVLIPKNPGKTTVWVKSDNVSYRSDEVRHDITVLPKDYSWRYTQLMDQLGQKTIGIQAEYCSDEEEQGESEFTAKAYLKVDGGDAAAYTGKPVKAYFEPDKDWIKYQKHGIANPPHVAYYIYPDGSWSEQEPVLPGSYVAHFEGLMEYPIDKIFTIVPPALKIDPQSLQSKMYLDDQPPQVKAIVEPAGSPAGNLTFSSSDVKVAVIDAVTGNITLVGPGTAVITVSSDVKGIEPASANIEVLEREPAPTAVPSPAPTAVPTAAPTLDPEREPSPAPTSAPTSEPVPVPTAVPTEAPALTPDPEEPASDPEPEEIPSDVPQNSEAAGFADAFVNSMIEDRALSVPFASGGVPDDPVRKAELAFRKLAESVGDIVKTTRGVYQ